MAVKETKTLFAPELVTDLLNKVKGKSSLARLSGQSPLPFNGNEIMTFSMDKEIDIVGENGQKTEGGITIDPVKVIPYKFEYGARISDEFLYATEEEKIEILTAFNEGFAAKLARGFDIAAFTGLNPRSKSASNIIGKNNFASKVETKIHYTEATADDNLEAAIIAVDETGGETTGLAMSKVFGAAMGKIKVNGIAQYQEFKFGASPEMFAGRVSDTNNTLNFGGSKIHAVVGDFASAFKWGVAKDIPLEIIKYGDPDNSGKDLKGYNQVYLRAEAYVGWGILVPEYFCKIEAAE